MADESSIERLANEASFVKAGEGFSDLIGFIMHEIDGKTIFTIPLRVSRLVRGKRHLYFAWDKDLIGKNSFDIQTLTFDDPYDSEIRLYRIKGQELIAASLCHVQICLNDREPLYQGDAAIEALLEYRRRPRTR